MICTRGKAASTKRAYMDRFVSYLWIVCGICNKYYLVKKKQTNTTCFICLEGLYKSKEAEESVRSQLAFYVRGTIFSDNGEIFISNFTGDIYWEMLNYSIVITKSGVILLEYVLLIWVICAYTLYGTLWHLTWHSDLTAYWERGILAVILTCTSVKDNCKENHFVIDGWCKYVYI